MGGFFSHKAVYKRVRDAILDEAVKDVELCERLHNASEGAVPLDESRVGEKSDCALQAKDDDVLAVVAEHVV